jgi:prepilin-type processing-associated H-X9-DG protein
MSPNDINMQTFVNAAGNGRTNQPGGAQVLFADGSVQFITEDSDPQMRSSLVTKDGQD